jgi:hypothetical protein
MTTRRALNGAALAAVLALALLGGAAARAASVANNTKNQNTNTEKEDASTNVVVVPAFEHASAARTAGASSAVNGSAETGESTATTAVVQAMAGSDQRDYKGKKQAAKKHEHEARTMGGPDDYAVPNVEQERRRGGVTGPFYDRAGRLYYVRDGRAYYAGASPSGTPGGGVPPGAPGKAPAGKAPEHHYEYNNGEWSYEYVAGSPSSGTPGGGGKGGVQQVVAQQVAQVQNIQQTAQQIFSPENVAFVRGAAVGLYKLS